MNKSTYIKKEFRNSFLELLKTKPLNKISVIELASKSGYSRQTFYRNFESIDDLIWFIHKDNVSVAHNLMYDLGFGEASLKLYLDLILLNKDFYKQIFTSDQNNIFVNLYVKRTKEKVGNCFLKCDDNLFEENEDFSFSLDFYTYSFSYTVIGWIKSNFEMSTSYLSEALIKNMPENLRGLIRKQVI